MAKIKGTNVVAPVVPLDTADVHPSHEALYGKGGYRTVATTAVRDAIPAPRREAGMLVHVVADGKVYKLLSDLASWEEFKSGASTWEELAGKPSTFPPSAHAHPIGDVTGLQSALDGKQVAGSYAALVHTHGISDVTGLQAALDGKAAASHTHTIANVTGLQSALDAKATSADVSSAVAAVVNAAPATLDTLAELAAALGSDANFATTVTNALAAKAPLASPTFTGTVSGVTKGMVGLGNVDNTADASKPVSTAQAAADAAVASAAAADATSKANAAQAAAVQRANHTGTQAISTVSGLQTAIDGKADTTDARLSDAREWSAATVTQAEAETGTSTSRLAFSPLRVFQAIAAWWAASAAKTKLDGISAGATANATDAQLRDRATHTGEQAHTTITGLGGAATLNVGTTAGTVAAGDDSRLTDQRVPTDGSVTTAKLADGAVTAAKIAASQTVTFGSVSAGTLAAGAGGVTATTGRLAVLGIGATTLFEVSSTGVVTTGTWQATAVAVDYGGTGATSASAARTNLGVAYGTTAGTVCEGNDSRLSNARTPTSHASTHQTGQADAINPVIVTPSSLSASQNDYAPGVCDIIRLSSSTAIDLTGLVAGTVDGAMRLVINTNASGGAAITLRHESASSTAANRFRNTTGGDFVLPADGGSAVLTYSSAISRWRIL
jgi:hypothetical protein